MKSAPLRNRIVYSIGSMGSSSVFFSTTLWLVYFYSPPPESGLPVLVPVLLIGAAMAVGRFIEAFDDPLIGHWSDVTNSRWGRRAPFVIFGMPFMALFFFLLWSPPLDHESVINGIYFFVVLELFYLAATVVLGPYEAMMPEIVVTPTDRVNLSSWKVLFGACGTAIALIVSPILVQQFGFKVMGLVVGGTAFVTLYVSLLEARGYMRFEHKPAEISFFDAAKSTLTNLPFLAFSAGLVLYYVGFNLLIQAMPFFVRVIMEESEDKVSWFTGGILVMLLLSLPFMGVLASRLGKKRAFAFGMLTLVLYMPLWYFIGFIPSVPKLAQGIIYVALAGVPFAALHVFPNALMADVIDYDETRTGQRREAIYYGMLETLKKIAFALSTAVFSLVLNLGCSVDNPIGIRLLGPIAAFSALVGFIIFNWGYRLPDVVTRDEVLNGPAEGVTVI